MAGKKKAAKSKGELLTASLRLRLTEAEKAAFNEAAEKDNRDLSGWLRHVARQAAAQAGIRVS
jgi:hypothetical protein